ncbi:MAG TPA: response regulator [Polyangia bacterium]
MKATHRIFVIEDEEMIRDSIVEFLGEQGYDAVGAVDGRDALDKLDGSIPRPCLILLDLMMPVMDGQSFRQRQLQIPDLAQIPVVVFSAYQDVAKTAVAMNAAGHLHKPLKLPDLLRTVQRHCKNGVASSP